MKHIIVKRKNGIQCYTSPTRSTINLKDGTSVPDPMTEEEEEQAVYQSLIDDVQREEFNKNIISLLKNHLEDTMADWTNIQIKLSFTTDKSCEMNVGNPETRFLIPQPYNPSETKNK